MARSRVAGVLFLLPLLLAVPASGAAADLSGVSRTHVVSRETGDGRDRLAFYEYLDVDLDGFGSDRLNIQAGGWGRLDVLDEVYGDEAEGELQYAFLRYDHPTSNARLMLGRVSVTEGTAAVEPMDGLWAGADLLGGFDGAVWAGVPVETDEPDRDGDLLWGARLSRSFGISYRLGVSYLKEEDDGDDFREEGGIEARLAPTSFLRVSGRSSYSFIDDAWASHDWRADLFPAARVSLALTARWHDYGAYFQSSLNPAFSPEAVDPEEESLATGAKLSWRAADALTLAASWTGYEYDLSGEADAFGTSLGWVGTGAGVGLSWRRVDGESERLRYDELGGYAWKRWGKAQVALDLVNVLYDADVNGKDESLAATLSLAWEPGESLGLAAALEYADTPDYDRELSGSLRVIYRFAAAFGGQGGAK